MRSVLRWSPVALLSIALMALGATLHPPTQWQPDDLPGVAFLDALVRWDSGWYGNIAANGYWYRPGEQSPVAFFPLYPALFGLLAKVGLNRWLAGSVVTLGAGLGALALFLSWASRLKPPTPLPAGAGMTAFFLLLLYPFSEYLYGVVYSDALFLFLVVGAFLALERDQVVLATCLGALATGCRPVAPAVVIGLLARRLELQRAAGRALTPLDFVPMLSAAGLLAYMGFLQVQFGDALAFAHVQAAPGWDNVPGWHSWLKVPWFTTMFPKVAPLVAIRLGGHALVTVIALALIPSTFKRLGWGYGVYTLLVVGLPAVSSKDFQGLGRYVIAAFPLFLTVATLVEPRPRVRRVLLVGFGAGLAVLSFALGAGGYVA